MAEKTTARAETTAPERAMDEVIRRHGVEGARAIATFMFAMGSGGMLTFKDADGEGWMPCDAVMQDAWARGGIPIPDSPVAQTPQLPAGKPPGYDRPDTIT